LSSFAVFGRRFVVRRFALVTVALMLLATTGCAAGVSRWIAETRNHQGDVALAHQNYPDASIAYQLALRVDPRDQHARAGLVSVQVRIAQQQFVASKFDDAMAALAVARKYAPGDDRVEALRSEIEQAEIKREIVLSNYPAYRSTGVAIRRSVTQVGNQTKDIAAALRRFDYTYDSNVLTQAIRESYDLNEQIAGITNRLIQYRQLVDSGAPENAESPAITPPASLLPLP
jgi:hypothetical protein